MTQRIWVTGSRGFIGHSLVRALCRGSDRTVVGLCRSNRNQECIEYLPERNVRRHEACGDVLDRDYLRRAMETFAPQVIFHLAGNPNARLREDDPTGHDLWRTNVDGTFNLLAYAPPGCRFVFASSAAVYSPRALLFGAAEDDPAVPQSLYGASKLAGETLVRTHHALGRVRGLCLRYVANVGPGATHGILLDVIRKLRDPGPELELLGERPGTCKPYCHVEDTVDATLELAFSGAAGVFNVGPADASCLTAEQVAEAAMEAVGVRKPVRWLGPGATWPGDNPRVSVDSGKLARRTRLAPRHPHPAEAVAAAARELWEVVR